MHIVESLHLLPSTPIWGLTVDCPVTQALGALPSLASVHTLTLVHIPCGHTTENRQLKKQNKTSRAWWRTPLLPAGSPREAEAGGPVSLKPVWSTWHVPGQPRFHIGPVSIKEKKAAIQCVLFSTFTVFYKLLLPNSGRCSSPKEPQTFGVLTHCSRFWRVRSAFCQWMRDNLAFCD